MSRRGRHKSGTYTLEASTLAPVVREDPVETLITRARKCRLKGDTRRALVTLREACALDEWRARTWTILGALLADLGHGAEATRAFRQARWLRLRVGDRARAAVLDCLIARVTPAAA